MNLRRIGLVLLALWALVFLAGTLGELFEIDSLRRWTDFKSIFLR